MGNDTWVWLDQVLHVTAGCALLVFFSLFMPIPLAFVFAMMIGVIREIWQRQDRGRPWYDCQIGCRLDLLFWFIGTVIGIAGLLIFRS